MTVRTKEGHEVELAPQRAGSASQRGRGYHFGVCNMAAQMRTDGAYSAVRLLKRKDFATVADACKSPPKPSNALRAFVAAARKISQEA